MTSEARFFEPAKGPRARASILARALAPALMLALLTSTGRAAAELRDPSEANAQADAIRREPGMDFCRAPRKPLPPAALGLCEMANEAEDCAGLKAACDAVLHKKDDEKPSELVKSILRALGAIAHVLVYVLVAVVLIAIAIPIVNAIRRRRRDAALAESIPMAHGHAAAPEELPALEHVDDAEDALRRADELARAGDLARATSLYLSASLAALDRRGAVRIVKSRTNGEYVRACTETENRPKLRGIATEVDRIQFGGEPPTAERVGRVAGLARALVRALPLALLVLGLAACGAPGHPKFDDPSGDQLFVELLKRQGFTTSPHGASLSSLAPLGTEAISPILVIDLDRTALEPDAEESVTAWVESGGVLVLFGTDNTKLATKYGFSSTFVASKDIDARVTPLDPPDVPDEDDDNDALYQKRLEGARRRATKHFSGRVAHGGAVKLEGSTTLVAIGDNQAYAAEKPFGKGVVVVVHDDDLTTNAVLARRGNAAVVAALFTELSAQPAMTGAANERRTREARAIRIARPEDGISPPSNPFAALSRAGLGRGMWHALFASLVLFFAYGIRHARPKPEAAPARRAFAEHVEATGAFYARAPRPAHALWAFARFAEDRVRHALPRGTTDVPTFLAARSGRSEDDCRELWERATSAKPDDETRGDELRTLTDLRAVVATATALRRDPSRIPT